MAQFLATMSSFTGIVVVVAVAVVVMTIITILTTSSTTIQRELILWKRCLCASPANEGSRNFSGNCSGRSGLAQAERTERWLSPTFSWSGSERVAGTRTEDAPAAAAGWCGRCLVLRNFVAMSLPTMRSKTADRWGSDERYWRRRDEFHVTKRLFCSAVMLTYAHMLHGVGASHSRIHRGGSRGPGRSPWS